MLENNKSINGDAKTFKKPENEKLLRENLEDLFKDMPLTDDTTCGFGIFRGHLLQKFANKKAYVFLYGVVGCCFAATYAYFNGTITTIEKRYKIPSRNTGIISVGNDISQLFLSAVLSYYAGKGHRPRWIAFGLFTIVIFCLMNALPHFMYGPGEDAFALTLEYGATYDENTTIDVMEKEKMKTLCRNGNSTKGAECETEEGNFAPQVILFIAQFISGVGGSLYFTLGVSYMDDNIQKSKTPALISLSYFLRMLGPAFGYALASFCLKIYISPTLTPTITTKDPRWLGAWWLGWIFIGVVLFVFGFLLGLFPKQLPRAAIRKRITEERLKRGWSIEEKKDAEMPASVRDMMVTFKRLVTNKTLMCNNTASIFYFFGYLPYWIFTPKYIETQYRQSASVSSLVTGTVALVFSAIGVLISGLYISKFKPKARYMAAWNVLVGLLSVFGMISYAFLGCPANDNSVNIHLATDTGTCNSNCQCDYVRYSPVCGENGNSYISACHAGCTQQHFYPNGTKYYDGCMCVSPTNASSPIFERWIDPNYNETDDDDYVSTTASTFDYVSQKAFAGSCPVDCYKEFVFFLTVMCLIKFTGATGRASNFLVTVRCVDEKDKPVAMGFGMMLMSLFAFIPSPIFFGTLLDKTCLVWGKTCTGQGNCWLYDGETLRYYMNFSAAIFVAIGTLFDVGVWYYVKDLKIFDDEIKETELLDFENGEDEVIAEKK